MIPVLVISVDILRLTSSNILPNNISLKKKEKPTCGIIVSLDLRSCRPIFSVMTSSMTMLPAAASMIRNRPKVMDDLPAPVLPTIPTYKIINNYKTLICFNNGSLANTLHTNPMLTNQSDFFFSKWYIF